MSELQPRQCHKCHGVMIPVRKTTYNFIASTYHTSGIKFPPVESTDMSRAR